MRLLPLPLAQRSQKSYRLGGDLLPNSRAKNCSKCRWCEVMNFRNRYLVISIRILLGLVMLASGISGLLMGNSTQGVPAKMVAFTQVFWASGIFQMVKVTEIVAGFMLLVGIFPALATLFLAPDVVGIVIVNARLMPSFLWIGAVVFVLTAYLGYAYWDKYKSIFSRN